jgi:hypothetical protein
MGDVTFYLREDQIKDAKIVVRTSDGDVVYSLNELINYWEFRKND